MLRAANARRQTQALFYIIRHRTRHCHLLVLLNVHICHIFNTLSVPNFEQYTEFSNNARFNTIGVGTMGKRGIGPPLLGLGIISPLSLMRWERSTKTCSELHNFSAKLIIIFLGASPQTPN